jgi:hypothetical protein
MIVYVAAKDAFLARKTAQRGGWFTDREDAKNSMRTDPTLAGCFLWRVDANIFVRSATKEIP